MARFSLCRSLVLPRVGERVPVTDDFTDVDQKIPDWLIKIPFLVKAETASRSRSKSQFGIMGFSTSDAILGLWFFSLINKPLLADITE